MSYRGPRPAAPDHQTFRQTLRSTARITARVVRPSADRPTTPGSGDRGPGGRRRPSAGAPPRRHRRWATATCRAPRPWAAGRRGPRIDRWRDRATRPPRRRNVTESTRDRPRRGPSRPTISAGPAENRSIQDSPRLGHKWTRFRPDSTPHRPKHRPSSTQDRPRIRSRSTPDRHRIGPSQPSTGPISSRIPSRTDPRRRSIDPDRFCLAPGPSRPLHPRSSDKGVRSSGRPPKRGGGGGPKTGVKRQAGFIFCPSWPTPPPYFWALCIPRRPKRIGPPRINSVVSRNQISTDPCQISCLALPVRSKEAIPSMTYKLMQPAWRVATELNMGDRGARAARVEEGQFASWRTLLDHPRSGRYSTEKTRNLNPNQTEARHRSRPRPDPERARNKRASCATNQRGRGMTRLPGRKSRTTKSPAWPAAPADRAARLQVVEGGAGRT